LEESQRFKERGCQHAQRSGRERAKKKIDKASDEYNYEKTRKGVVKC